MSSSSARRKKDTKETRGQTGKDLQDSRDSSIPDLDTNVSQTGNLVPQHVEALSTTDLADVQSPAGPSPASVDSATTEERYLVRYLDETIQSCDDLYASCLTGIQYTLNALRAELASGSDDQVRRSRIMAGSRTLSSDIVPLLDLHKRLRILCEDIKVYHGSPDLRIPEAVPQSTVDTQSATHSLRLSQAHQAWSEYTVATRDMEQSSSDDGSLSAEISDQQGRVLGTCNMIAKLLFEKGDLGNARRMRDLCANLEGRQTQAAIASSRQQQQSARDADQLQYAGATNPRDDTSEGNFDGLDLKSIQDAIEPPAGSETS